MTAMPGKRGEKPGAGLGEFVEHERGAGELGEDREQAGAGRGLEHEIGRRDRGGGAGREASAIGVENCCSAWLSSERRVWVGRRPASLASIGSKAAGERPRAHGRTEFAQEQDRRRLAGVVGGLPVPGAFGVGAAEGVLHRGAEHGASMRRPRSRWGRRPRGLGDARGLVAGVGATESGAAATAAAETEESIVM